jgi:hypothetical protein
MDGWGECEREPIREECVVDCDDRNEFIEEVHGSDSVRRVRCLLGGLTWTAWFEVVQGQEMKMNDVQCGRNLEESSAGLTQETTKRFLEECNGFVGKIG